MKEDQGCKDHWFNGQYTKYNECKKRYTEFDEAMHTSDRQCRSAVRNREAAELILRASDREPNVPVPIGRSQDAAAELNAQIETGSPAVDKYREQSFNRAANASSNLQVDGLDEISRQTNSFDFVDSTTGSSAQSTHVPATGAHGTRRECELLARALSLGDDPRVRARYDSRCSELP